MRAECHGFGSHLRLSIFLWKKLSQTSRVVTLLIFQYVSHSGGWGLVGIGDNESQWNINGTEFLYEKVVGSPAFFSLAVEVDDKNSSIYVLTVSVLYLASPCLYIAPVDSSRVIHQGVKHLCAIVSKGATCINFSGTVYIMCA